MSWLPTALEVLGALGLPSSGIAIWRSKSLNRKVDAQAEKLGSESANIIATTSTGLVKMLNDELAAAKKEIRELRDQVAEMGRDLAANKLMLDEQTDQLQEQKTRADYYQAEFERVTGRRRPPPEGKKT